MLSLLAHRDQSRLYERLEMVRNGRLHNREQACQLTTGKLATPNNCQQDADSLRIGERTRHLDNLLGLHLRTAFHRPMHQYRYA